MIKRDALVEMFENIARAGSWDVTRPMLWGYFFTHDEPAALQAAIPLLEGQGYEFVDVHQSAMDHPSDAALWWLHVQRVEIHSVDTLFARNELLSEFAERYGIDSYDGMDVGPPPVLPRLG